MEFNNIICDCMAYMADLEFSCLHELSRCSTDKENSSTEVGVVVLDKIYDWFRRFETMETMDQPCVTGRKKLKGGWESVSQLWTTDLITKILFITVIQLSTPDI